MMLRVADLIRVTLLVGMVIALVTGRVEVAFRFGVVLGLTLVARWLRVPGPFGLAFTAVLGCEAWGRFAGWYRVVPAFDEVIHLLMMGCAAPLVYLLLARGQLVPELAELEHTRQRVALPGLSVLIGLALGAVWEIYEWSAVQLLGVNIIIGYADTIFDLLLDLLGALVGGVLLVVWALKRWPSQMTRHPPSVPGADARRFPRPKPGR